MNDRVNLTPLTPLEVGEVSSQDADQIQDMGQLLESLDSMKTLHRGDIIEGIVMRADNDGIIVYTIACKWSE